ncbi:hypothetical protein EVAR_64546_1 [Eumeta japonica]|uniref:Uncharacterized protein n=1 Tax=Eumeta variegata TaxID=151549 RepID=A0A4C1ZWA2_EUMVA|nr:hypothetical protein EVAR_64546_1 [Eumeta japonica]
MCYAVICDLSLSTRTHLVPERERVCMQPPNSHAPRPPHPRPSAGDELRGIRRRCDGVCMVYALPDAARRKSAVRAGAHGGAKLIRGNAILTTARQIDVERPFVTFTFSWASGSRARPSPLRCTLRRVHGR